MATNKENPNILNESSNEINEDEFLDAQLPPSPQSSILETSYNSSSSINNKNSRNTNNNRHVVPFGILIVFCTLYITTSAFQGTNQTKKGTFENEPEAITTISELRQKEQRPQSTFLNELFEQKDICNELEIFGDKFQWTATDSNSQSIKQKKRKSANQIRKHIGKKLIKNGKNGKRFNKSTTKSRKFTNKHSIANNKEQNKKKNSTAEPIIYLFALVLIYLLFKAASDINQHYKTQAKGDKRLRRCSLQSYAQAHKQDRRASKDHSTPNILNRKHQLLQQQQRTQSLDRFYMKPDLKDTIKRVEFLSNLQKQISIDEIMQNPIQNQKLMPSTTSYSKILYDQNIQTQSAGNIFNTSSDFELSTNRRCSVPALMTAPKSKTSNNPVGPAANRRTSVIQGANVGQLGQLGSSFDATHRRTSVTHGTNIASLGGSFDATDPFQFSECKRRVRMINRH